MYVEKFGVIGNDLLIIVLFKVLVLVVDDYKGLWYVVECDIKIVNIFCGIIILLELS